MNRVALSIASIAIFVTAASASAAPPTTVNGGPVPDPNVTKGCIGESTSIVMYNGGPMTANPPKAPSAPLKSDVSSAPIAVNGGYTPSPMQKAAPSAAGWCGGAYRPDAGSNFSGS